MPKKKVFAVNEVREDYFLRKCQHYLDYTYWVKDNFPNSKIVVYGTDLDAWNIHICKNHFLTNTPKDVYNSDWFNDYYKSLDFGKSFLFSLVSFSSFLGKFPKNEN